MTEFEPAGRLRGIQKSAIRQLFDRARPGSINLGLGEPDLPTPEVIRREAVRVISEEQNGYTSHAGLPALRERVARDYPALNLTPDEVIITAGSQEALYLALMTIVDEGDEVLLPDPGFVAYPTIVRMAGGVPVFYRMPKERDFGFDAEELARCLTPRTKAVVAISPSNPTGRVLHQKDLEAMAEALRGTGVFAISDEIYRDLYFTEERPGSLSDYYERTIVISGLSKSMSMTGWRLGWLCGDAGVIKSALVLHGYVTTCASTVSQKAALAAWTEEAADERAKARSIFKERCRHLLSLIRDELSLSAVMPEGAFYTMMNVEPYGTSMEVAERLLEHGVITVPGAAFGRESEGTLRVSFCADLPRLTEGVRRMREALTNSR
ncbi:MAG TPA: aminotransferase class I/II-fold pyridoxal phosphate-dependent enzyme [Pyrinomonadaceae bacterium]|nr:aminotransferase class I/II-fold pyridoxal phosphate-dependent enzyme [Pyrinomonadaceae bacterium]